MAQLERQLADKRRHVATFELWWGGQRREEKEYWVTRGKEISPVSRLCQFLVVNHTEISLIVGAINEKPIKYD